MKSESGCDGNCCVDRKKVSASRRCENCNYDSEMMMMMKFEECNAGNENDETKTL